MKTLNAKNLTALYKRDLFDKVMPFWINNAIDHEYGGYMTWLDRDGKIISTDKPVWMQGRGVWTFSRLFNEFGKNDEYLEAAVQGYRFLKNYCKDSDGRMFFRMNREGNPVMKRRYVFSDVFAAAGFAEYYRATEDEEALELAKKSFRTVYDAFNVPGAIPPKYQGEMMNFKAHSPSMIIIDLCKTMRAVDDTFDYTGIINDSCRLITKSFYKPELGCLLENTGPFGEYMSHIPEGRCVNPGHAIESAWFILEEAMEQNNMELQEAALGILDDSLEIGWDREFGGLLYFVDSEGKPPYALEWDMKLWWPHNEALYALLLAFHATGNPKYSEWYEKVHDWSFARFNDEEYGEWFGYLHRDGSLASSVKGSVWKGPFHVPRFYLKGIQVLEKIKSAKAAD
ncbi:MAG: AGE family epimerase/isomerase [Clostridia bacterium]|nr:AGE family epimerase/isomerase [Clostridia bacterium]